MSKRYNPNKYNDDIVALIQHCFRDMMEIAAENGIDHIEFHLHPNVDKIYARFDDDDNNAAVEEVQRMTFVDNSIIITSNNFSAYVDECYGDYFDVADKMPKLYKALVECVEDGIKDSEKVSLEC